MLFYPSQHSGWQLVYPSSIISRFCSVYSTFAPLLESIQPYVQVFHQLQYNTQLESFSAGKMSSAVLTIPTCMKYVLLCVVGFIYSGVEVWTLKFLQTLILYLSVATLFMKDHKRIRKYF